MEAYSKSKAIFGIYRVDLHNRILISTWFDDLHFSASTTVRPKLCGQSARRVLVIEIFFFFKKFLEYLGLPENAWHYPNFQLLLNFGHPIVRYFFFRVWKLLWRFFDVENWYGKSCYCVLVNDSFTTCWLLFKTSNLLGNLAERWFISLRIQYISFTEIFNFMSRNLP